MPDHIVFVRFFPCYSEGFPYERFLSVPDDEILRVAEALCNDWDLNPANRERLHAMRAESYRAAVKGRMEWAKKVRLWEQGTLARPGTNWCLPPKPRSIKKILAERPPPELRTGPVRVEEVVTAEGWRGKAFCPPWTEGDRPLGISRRFAVALFDRIDRATGAAAALQSTATELAEATYLKRHWEDADDWLAGANPRFFSVAARGLPGGALAVAIEQMQRVRGPVVKPPSPEECLVRVFWPYISPILDQLGPAPHYGQGVGRAASKTTPHSKTTNAPEPSASSRLPHPDPYSVRVENHEELAKSIAAELTDRPGLKPPRAPLTAEDKTILTVLTKVGHALTYAEIVRDAANLVRNMRGTPAERPGLIPLSETKVAERVPILERDDLVSRPLGKDDKPTTRKGIGITERGLAILNITPPLPG